MRSFGLFCLAWLTAATLAARDVYVDNVAGEDLFLGRTAKSEGFDGPVRTIARALKLAAPHDRIVLANTGVPYRESVSLSGGRHSGSRLEPFLLEGNGAVLDGSAPIDPQVWSPVRGQRDVFRFRPPRKAYQQIFLAGKPLKRVSVDPIDGPPELAPLQWYLWRGYVYLRIEEGKWIDDYALSHAALTTGVTLYHVRHAVVVDLVVQGFQLDGIQAHDAFDCTLHAVTCRGNGRSGIAITGASRVTIEGCLSGDNALAQLLTEGLSTTELRDTQLLPGVGPELLRRGGRLQQVQPDP
jgi:hypothetical protein